MIEIFTTIITNFFRTFIIKRFMKIFFHTEIENKWKEFLCYSLFFGVTALVHVTFHYPPANIAANILFIYLITQLYNGSQKKKLFVTLLVYGTNMFCDIIAWFTVNNYIPAAQDNGASVYVTILLIGISEFVIEKFLVKNKEIEVILPCGNLLLSISGISIVVLIFLIMLETSNKMIIAGVGVCILAINLLMFYLYDILITAYIRLEKNALMERQMDSYSYQLNVMMESEEKVSRFRHDMKNHFIELLGMAERIDNKEIISYVCSMQKEMENPQEYSKSGNKEVDSLLNYMLREAETSLNHVEHKICVPVEMKINIYDFNIIVGNLLDNAISAAKHSKDKFLSLTVRYEKEMLLIQVRNSFEGKLREENGVYRTTKQEWGKHGIGLQNVKRVVERHNGSFEIKSSNNIFDVKILLYV